MPNVTLPSLLSAQKPSASKTNLLLLPSSLISGGNADKICLRLSGLAWMFSSTPLLPTIWCAFSRLLTVPSKRKWGISDGKMKPGAYFPFLPLSPSFFHCPLCFSCLGSDLDRHSAVQLEMPWIFSQVGALARKSGTHRPPLCSFAPKGKMHKIPKYNVKARLRTRYIHGSKCIWRFMDLLLFFDHFLIFLLTIEEELSRLHSDSDRHVKPLFEMRKDQPVLN